jgi:hypothetical protein
MTDINFAQRCSRWPNILHVPTIVGCENLLILLNLYCFKTFTNTKAIGDKKSQYSPISQWHWEGERDLFSPGPEEFA